MKSKLLIFFLLIIFLISFVQGWRFVLSPTNDKFTNTIVYYIPVGIKSFLKETFFSIPNIQKRVGALERIDDIHKNRSSYENLYKKVISSQPFEFQKDLKNRKRITWLVSVLINNKDRDKLLEVFQNQGLDARPFFLTLSSMDIYKKYSSKVNPFAKKISNTGISLPTYESLKSLEEIEEILNNILNTTYDEKKYKRKV